MCIRDRPPFRCAARYLRFRIRLTLPADPVEPARRKRILHPRCVRSPAGPAQHLPSHIPPVSYTHLLGKIQRKAERIIQLERVNARQHAALALGSSLFDVVDEIRQDIQALVDGAGEALLLCGYSLFD